MATAVETFTGQFKRQPKAAAQPRRDQSAAPMEHDLFSWAETTRADAGEVGMPAKVAQRLGAMVDEDGEALIPIADGADDSAEAPVRPGEDTTTENAADAAGPLKKGQAREAALRRLGDLRGRLDAREASLRRGRRGEYDRHHACRLAGFSTKTLATYQEVRDALDALAQGRDLEEPPKRAPGVRMRKQVMLKRLNDLSSRLRPTVALPVSLDGGTDRAAIARMAGLGPGWDEHPQVLARIDQLAVEHAPAGAAIDEQAALAAMDAWGLLLAETSDKVPSSAGQPAIALAACQIGVAAAAIRNSTSLCERLLEIARVVGLRAAVPEHKGRSPLEIALNKLHDERDTCALRGEVFPAKEDGQLNHQALLKRLGLCPDMVIQLRFRTLATSLHRGLWAAAGRGTLDPDACHLNEAHAVADRYELYVLAGIQSVPRDKAGEVALGHFEHSYQLTVGTCRRFPEIAARVRAAVAAAEGTSDVEKARDAALASVMDALAAYETGPAAARGVAVTHGNRASHRAIERVMLLREGSIDFFEEARRAVAELAERLGKAAHKCKRHQDTLDPLIDRYIAHVHERGFLYPRKSPFANHMNVAATAGEITRLTGVPVTAAQLDKYWQDRIHAECRGLIRPGPVRTLKAIDVRAPDDRLFTLLDPFLATFKNGLPGDPLDERNVDLARVADGTWIDLATLAATPAYLDLIEQYREKFGLQPFRQDAAMITAAELLTRVRERRAEDTTSGRPGEAVARTVRALSDLVGGRGLSLEADLSAVPEFGAMADVSVLPAQIVRLRGYLAEMRRERMLPDDLPTSLKVLLRTAKMTPAVLRDELNRRLGRNLQLEKVQRWVRGASEPSYHFQDCVDEIERMFELPVGTLTRKMCEDSRPRGRIDLAVGGIPIPPGYDIHLPLGYELLSPDKQKAVLLDIAETVRCQNTDYSRKHRVVTLDEYRLKREQWPERLQQEWKDYYNRRRTPDAMEIGAEVRPRQKAGDDKATPPLGAGGADRLLNALESFFGFLVRPAVLDALPPSILPSTPEWRRERAEADAKTVGYRAQPGLGIPPDKLSFGLVSIRDFYRAWVAYMIGRSGDEGSETLMMVNFFGNLLKEDRFVRTSEELRDRAADLLDWWAVEQSPDLRRRFKLQPLERKGEAWAHRCDHALELYDEQYLKLLDRRAGRNGQPRLRTRRDPFAPIRKVLKSSKPLKY